MYLGRLFLKCHPAAFSPWLSLQRHPLSLWWLWFEATWAPRSYRQWPWSGWLDRRAGQ